MAGGRMRWAWGVHKGYTRFVGVELEEFKGACLGISVWVMLWNCSYTACWYFCCLDMYCTIAIYLISDIQNERQM